MRSVDEDVHTAGGGNRDVGFAVAVQITENERVQPRASAEVDDWRERSASSVDEHAYAAAICDRDIDRAITIQVADRH